MPRLSRSFLRSRIVVGVLTVAVCDVVSQNEPQFAGLLKYGSVFHAVLPSPIFRLPV